MIPDIESMYPYTHTQIESVKIIIKDTIFTLLFLSIDLKINCIKYNAYNLRWNIKIHRKISTTKLTQEEIENLSRLTTSKEIKLVIKKLHLKEISSPDIFTGGFYQIYKGELISSSSNNKSRVNIFWPILWSQHSMDS